MSTIRQVNTAEFLAANPVFSVDEAAAAFKSPRGTRAAVERFRRYLDTGRLKLLARGLYAVVPLGQLGRDLPTRPVPGSPSRPT